MEENVAEHASLLSVNQGPYHFLLPLHLQGPCQGLFHDACEASMV
jgi:hypothetical protein